MWKIIIPIFLLLIPFFFLLGLVGQIEADEPGGPGQPTGSGQPSGGLPEYQQVLPLEPEFQPVLQPTTELSKGFAILLFSIILWVFALFFLFEATEMLKWIFKKEEGSPNPKTGVYISFMVSMLVIIIWTFQSIVVRGSIPGNWLFDLLLYPREYAPGFLLASFFPIAVGLLKLLTVVAASPRTVPMGGTPARPLGVALVYVAAGIINVMASIVTLSKLIRL